MALKRCIIVQKYILRAAIQLEEKGGLDEGGAGGEGGLEEGELEENLGGRG